MRRLLTRLGQFATQSVTCAILRRGGGGGTLRVGVLFFFKP